MTNKPSLPIKARLPGYVLKGTLYVLGLNLLFFTLNSLTVLVPANLLKQRIIDGYRDKVLFHSSDTDMAAGYDQFSDCATLENLYFHSGSPWLDAVSPHIGQLLNHEAIHPCGLLYREVAKGEAMDHGIYYHRYWHGARMVSGLLLYFFPLRVVRKLIQCTCYLSFVLLFIAAIRVSLFTGIAFLPIALFGLLFSGTNFFGQSVIHGPAFAAGVLCGVIPLWFWKKLRRRDSLFYLCLALGCIGGYFENLCGVLLTSSALIFLGLYFVSREFSEKSPWISPMFGILAFGVGCVFTTAFKQTLAVAFFGWQNVIGIFYSELAFRLQGSNEYSGDIAHVCKELWQNLSWMTRFSAPAAHGLFYSSVAALVLSGILTTLIRRRKNDRRASNDFMAFFIASLFPLGWYAAFRGHTVIHAWFMTRFLYLPLSFVWSSLVINLYHCLGYLSHSTQFKSLPLLIPRRKALEDV